VAISSYSPQIAEAYELADSYRELGIPVVLGGLHASSVPDEAKVHCDAVVIGEGEASWPGVLKNAEAGALEPIYRATGDEFDLRDAPMPAFELLDTDQYNRLTVQTSRGCPHRCEFCASSVLLTNRYKQKPVERVLAEIDRICEIWPHPFIEFADDNSIVNKAYWKRLLGELKGRRLRWFAETDISVAHDAELLRLMRESGCMQVLIGLESPTQGPLDGVETHRNWKMTQWPTYAGAIRTIQSHGISVNGCFVIGLDGHGPQVFDQVVEFVEATGLHEVQVTVQTAFPGTPLYDRLLAEGRLLDPAAWHTCTLFDVNFEPKQMSVEALRNGFRDLVVRLYSDESTHARRDRFRQFLRASRQGGDHDSG